MVKLPSFSTNWAATILVVPLVLATGFARAAEAPAAPAVDAPPSPLAKLKVSGAWRSRLEMWNFFEPSGAAGGNNSYNFYGSDARLNAAWTDDWFDVFAEGQVVGLAGLPDNSVGTAAEGPFGVGSVYRSNNDDNKGDSSIFLRQGSLKLKKLGVRGLSLKGGRQVFSEGKEAVPADPTLAWVQTARVSERLIGPFDYTYTGRSFDSAIAAFTRGALNVTGFYGKPTQGGFNVEGMKEIDSINVAYGAVNLNHPEFAPNTAGRLFYIYYDDDRPLVKVDNRPLAARQADTGNIAIHTIGADVLQLVPTPLGPIDLLGWFAYQAGDWGLLDQSSWALAVEAGFQPSELPWKPWFRIGYNMGSGDGNNADGDHESFFQILPTARAYSLSTFYNMMNSEDFFVQAIAKPIAGLVWRTDFHLLRLSDDNDLWYFGGGATREHKQAGFGYGGRPSGGGNSLMEVLETQISYNWNDYLATTVYYGHAFGEDVVGADFQNKNADYGFIEVTLKLPPVGPK